MRFSKSFDFATRLICLSNIKCIFHLCISHHTYSSVPNTLSTGLKPSGEVRGGQLFGTNKSILWLKYIYFLDGCLLKTYQILFYIRIHELQKRRLPKVFCKKSILKNFANFTWKRLCQSLFFIKVAGLRRDSGTVALRWILRIFWEHLLYGTLPMAACGVNETALLGSHFKVLMVFSDSINALNRLLNPWHLLTYSFTI